MQPIPGDLELLHHYSVFIYPFHHHVVGRQRNARLGSLESRWTPWASRFHESDLATSLEATSFFLPYIRGLLYPDITRLEEATATDDSYHWAQVLRAWSSSGMAAYARDLPASGVLRLTLRPNLLSAMNEMLIVQEGWAGSYSTESVELPSNCQWIDSVLFPSGLGFLLLNVRLSEPQPHLSSLIRLNQALRQVHPPKRCGRMPVLRLTCGEELTVRDLMNFLMQGLAGPWNLPEEDRGIFPPPTAVGSVERPRGDRMSNRDFGDRCFLVSYACVDLAKSGQSELPLGPFASPGDRLLFEYATSIGLGESVTNPVWIPSCEQAQRLGRDNRLAFWRCWTGMVLKESLVFLATEDLGFTRRSLPRYIENDYLSLYLFALYQKLQLFTFASDMMHEVAHSSGHLQQARALQERFVAFRSQYWFTEVTRTPQGGELYRTFQRGLEVQTSYDLVTSSVKDVKDYYEGVWNRQMQLFKDAITFGGPVTVAFGAVRMIIGESPHTWTIGGLLAACAVLLFMLRMGLPGRWLRRRRRGRGAQRKRFKDLPGMWQPRRQTPSVPV